MSTLNDFKSNLSHQVFRNNQFDTTFNFPSSNMWEELSDTIQYYVSSIDIPATVVSTVDMAIHGEVIKIPTFVNKENITITFLADAENKIYSMFENEMQKFSSYDERRSGLTSFLEDFAANTITITAGKFTRQFVGAYPINVASYSLTQDQQSAPQTIAVEFAYLRIM